MATSWKRQSFELPLPEPKKCKLEQLRKLEEVLETKPDLAYSEFQRLYEYGDALVMSKGREALVWEVHRIKVTKFRAGLASFSQLDQTALVDFLDGAITFYTEVVDKVRVREGGLEEPMPVWENARKSKQIMESVRNCCRRLLMHLGDLERYKMLYGNKQEFLQARRFYKQAFEIDYSFGEAHNQIGALFLCRGQYPEAMYHFVRGMHVITRSLVCYKNVKLALGLQQYESTRFSKRPSNDEFSEAFRDLMRVLATKDRTLPVALLDQALETFSSTSCGTSPMKALFVIYVLLASVDDYYTDGFWTEQDKRAHCPERLYLYQNLLALLKFGIVMAATREDRDQSGLPAVGILFLWLARHPETVRAMLETDELRADFKHLVNELNKLLLVCPALKLDKEAKYLGFMYNLWEDVELSGCRLIFKPDERVLPECSNNRLLRLKAALYCIGEALPVGDCLRDDLMSSSGTTVRSVSSPVLLGGAESTRSVSFPESGLSPRIPER